MTFTNAIAEAAANTDMNTAKEQTLTQEALEKEMAAFGKARAERMMANNEERGSADTNPYAQAIYKRFVLPLAAMVRTDIKTPAAGRNKAHVTLLEPIDPEAVAFLTVRTALNALMTDTVEGAGSNGRSLMTAIGRSVHHELMLNLFSAAKPELFFTLVNDLHRRMSVNERHRMTVFKTQMAEVGVTVPEWGVAHQQQVGAYLLDQLEALGMVTIAKSSVTEGKKRRAHIIVNLTAKAYDVVSQIKEMVAETTPYFLPCIERPKDWVSMMDGGWHTNDMRRLSPFCIKSHTYWEKLAEQDLTRVFAAINGLQKTAWQISPHMLDVVKQVSRHFDMEEIISQAEQPAPPKPQWLTDGMKVEHMSPEEQDEFTVWKRLKREWFTEMRVRGSKYGRFVTALRVAEKFERFNEIFFVYFADFRGRLYAQSTGVSPQGSDLQKALIRFAKGKPLDTQEAVRWFMINGANKWGYDKDSLDGRVEWVKKHHDNIISFATDPISHSDWRDADAPLQFLAWCLEYKAWTDSPHDFVSHIPVAMDGSCNGLQNFSAMLRDEVGGKATNLLPSPLPCDIYQQVADVTLMKLRRLAPRPVPEADAADTESQKAAHRAEMANRHLAMWIKHGIPRALVKRSVMTLPYGSTRFSCADFIEGDYLREGKAPEFARNEYSAAAGFLSHIVWESIGEVVVKAKVAMDWLQSQVKTILENNDEIGWTTPDGFPVIQAYQEQSLHRINTKLQGNTKIRVYLDSEKPCLRSHKNGIAPNFVHSYDATHMRMVIVAAALEGLDLAMIHDDYGTHAADAEKLYRIIRSVFVGMYEQNAPLEELAERYDLPAAPEKGNLDLRQVLVSPYFFS